MEGGRSKEIAVIDVEEEEEEEEEKINTFFILVRKIRDARSELVIGKSETREKGKEKSNEMKSTWTPSFKMEDFGHDAALRSHFDQSLVSSSKSKKEEKCKTGKHLDIDLNL
ncbi:Protein NEGATIVE REGULATOR OF RESISTANCE like [Quillaja saponaria]|uniref:Protein NEGATIVE REGULATOR OF RESISTANCE like n=1 Tax=Quillaja saponaria TaxID=32244 RepID=A0AAD7QA46_QUISA|nr:Protein NEGATIVE REGULATOR OF RESISTANCE like [Quillaja saponaria]